MNPPHPLMGIWIVDKTINTWKEFLMSMTLMATFFFTIPNIIPGLTERFHEHSRGTNLTGETIQILTESHSLHLNFF
jgi:hypothetical protein